jgi:hypothetical protein
MSDCCPSSASAQIEGIVLDKPTGTWNTWTAQRRYLSTRVLQLPALDVAILPLFTSYTLVSNCSINTPVHVSSDHFQPGVSSSRRLAAGHIHDQTLPIDKPHHIPHAACLASGTADQSLSSNSGVSCGVSSPHSSAFHSAYWQHAQRRHICAVDSVSRKASLPWWWWMGVSLSRLLSVSSCSRYSPRADNSTRCNLTPSLINRITAGCYRSVKTATEVMHRATH